MYWAELLFEAEDEVAEAVGEAGCGPGAEEVVRQGEAKLRLVGDPEARRDLREIVGVLACVRGLEKAVLKLKASAGDDNAGVCDLRTIGGDSALGVGSAGLSTCVERESFGDRGEEERT